MSGTETHIVACGALGGMGLAVSKLAEADSKFVYAGGIEHRDHEIFFCPDPEAAKKANIHHDLQTFLHDYTGAHHGGVGAPVVVVSFIKGATAEEGSAATVEIAEICKSWKVPFVCGTTAITSEDMNKLIKFSDDIPIVYDTNMNAVVALMRIVVKQVAEFLDKFAIQADAEILDPHHNRKSDSPSGTSEGLGGLILRARGDDLEYLLYGRKGDVGPRTVKEVCIHSVRGGDDYVCDIEIRFYMLGQEFTMRHRVNTRVGYAQGALIAAQRIILEESGMYDMNWVYGIES